MRTARLIISGLAAAAVLISAGAGSARAGVLAPTAQVARFGDFDYGTPAVFDFGHSLAVSSLFWFPARSEQQAVSAAITQIHAAHPGEKLLAYMAPVVTPSATSAYFTCLPWKPDWPLSYYLTLSTPTGHRAPISFLYRGLTLYRLNPADAAVRAACVDTIEAIVRAGGYDGVLLDFGPTTLELARLAPGGCRESLCASETAWQQAVAAFYADIAAQLHHFRPGLLVLANIAGGGSAPAVWRTYLASGLDGAMEEGFLYGTDHVLHPDSIAGELQNVLWDEANGKLTLLNGDIRPLYDAQPNTLAATMMMMVAGGRTEWVINNGDYGDPPRWLPVYTELQQLGAPLGPYAQTGQGAFVRRFQNGYLLANPTGSALPAPSPLTGEIPAYGATIDFRPGCPGCGASGIAAIVQRAILAVVSAWPSASGL